MKITLTKSEIVSLLNGKFGLGITTNELEIVDDVPLYVRAIYQVQREFPNYLTNQKLFAIKRLRELCPMGLFEAKYTLEDVSVALVHYSQTQTFYKG